MKQKFALVCTNEAHGVVSLRMFDSYDEAYSEMAEEFNREFKDNGETGEPEDAGINDYSARFSLCDDYGYYWQIMDVVL